jgi:hypothetical protein
MPKHNMQQKPEFRNSLNQRGLVFSKNDLTQRKAIDALLGASVPRG